MRVYWSVLSVLLAVGCSKTRGAEERQTVGNVPQSGQETVIRPVRVAASSEHVPNPGYTFVAANLIDGALNTSWQPASSDLTSPKWVRLDFDRAVTLTAIAIANGFQAKDRYGDEFLLNRKIARARLRFEDASEIPVRFTSDARGYVRFAIPNKTTQYIELLIDDTYAGSKWNDLAISEIEATGIVSLIQAVVQESIVETVNPARDEWWTSPPGERKSIEALAYGFAGVDEKDLGTMFTADFKPIYGAPSLFEDKPPRRVRRDGMEKIVMKLRNSSQLDTGFQWLFLRVGTHYENDRDYQVIRAMQVSEVVRVDESARMRRPPPNAVFYLAEVHRGASFDLFVDGRRSAMGTQLDLLFAQGDGTAKHVRASSSYRLKAFGLGLRDLGGEGIFAMTPQQIQERYRAGEPVPVQLVFRTVPGRSYKPREYSVPVAVVDESNFALRENAQETWTIPPGKYWVEMSSSPNGSWLTWKGNVSCDSDVVPRREYTSISMHCTVTETAGLSLTNPSTFGLGPSESVSLYVERR